VGSTEVTTFSEVTWPPASVAMTRARAADPVRSVTLIPSQAERAIFGSMTAIEPATPVPSAPVSVAGALAPVEASGCGARSGPTTPLPVTAPRLASPLEAVDEEDEEGEAP